MRIALDTNVLVSGLLKGYSTAGMIVRLVAGGLVQVVYDARILTEYREVLARPKFSFEESLVKAILVQIEEEGVLVTTAPLPERLPDPDDEPFLEVARAAGVILVTGNKKHFPRVACGPVRVMSPTEFIRFWRESCGGL
ncbi:putative PIN family toxin of toxin-antitoxin system [Thermodesulfitimonas autotrophica]|uniref:Putative PIN family toxin of toxin-antitoxin system n=1 Tax=Thermodesulfitimonas autotrophica TaxID=1894989 RepID=A0A3N5BVK7_9THEO|nr:putative toxin-antitoxin system toxin component, PIN family [Thermodesulfitimonas autotrophica]RPF49935.1 putative PIN family toxin of toxin-antitoxin system [Thermodesulfitimonas autotrophica]